MIIAIVKYSDGFNMINAEKNESAARTWLQGMRDKCPEILKEGGITITGTELIEVAHLPQYISEN